LNGFRAEGSGQSMRLFLTAKKTSVPAPNKPDSFLKIVESSFIFKKVGID